MKKIIFISGIFALVFGLIMCEKETVNKISFIKTEMGGCNGEDFTYLKNATEEHGDTILFTIRNDTLDIYVGINYICCAPFISETRVTNDSIILTINDTCKVDEQLCYCRCMCYYTWNFLFVDFEQKEYAFKVILNDPRTEGPIVFREGVVDLKV